MKLDLRSIIGLGAMALIFTQSAFSQEMSPEDTKIYESYASVIFKKDIAAGIITVQKAALYYKCANDRYIEKMGHDALFELAKAEYALFEESKSRTQISDTQREGYDRIQKEAFQRQKEASEFCRIKLSIDSGVIGALDILTSKLPD